MRFPWNCGGRVLPQFKIALCVFGKPRRCQGSAGFFVSMQIKRPRHRFSAFKPQQFQPARRWAHHGRKP